MKSKLIWLISGITGLSLSIAGVGGYFLVDSLNKQEPEPECTYEIVMEDEIEILSDRTVRLSPIIIASEGEDPDGRFSYKYDAYSEYISIDDNGVVSVLKPTDEVIEITVIEKKTGTQKTVKLKIVAELSEVLEIRDFEGAKLDSALSMEIGESYSFSVVTMPTNAAIKDYFSFLSLNGEGEAKDVFDVSVSENQITLTAVGVGSGDMQFNLVNEAQGLDFCLEIPFSVSFPDATFNTAVLETTGQSLLSGAEVRAIERLVFGETATSFSIEKYDLLTSLRTMVFSANEIVTVTGAELDEDLAFRVRANEILEGKNVSYDWTLLSAYLNDGTWGQYASNIYPYLDTEHEKPVVVYHNKQTYAYGGDVFDGEGIVHKEDQTYDYVQAQTAPAIKAVNTEVGQVETYVFDGYTFTGWTDALGETFTSENLETVQEGVHVYANWTANEYTVTLNDLNIQDMPYQTVTAVYNQGIPDLSYGEKYGWTFKGWYLSDEYEEDEKVSGGIVYHSAEDLTLYAKYETDITLNYCGIFSQNSTITNAVYGKPLASSLELSEDKAYSIAQRGWTFEGWNYSLDYTSKSVIDSVENYIREGDGDGFLHILYAKFTHQLSFDTLGLSDDILQPLTLIGGLNVGESMAVYGIESEDLVIDAKENSGWTFSGWTLQRYYKDTSEGRPIGYGDAYLNFEYLLNEDKDIPASYTTAYAIYESENTFRYGTFGELDFTETITYGCRTRMPQPDPHAEGPDWTAFDGYTFVGWYDGENESSSGKLITEAHANKVYQAKYDANVYKIYFKDQYGQDAQVGYKIYSDTYTNTEDHVLNNDGESWIGRTVDLPKTPDKVGYTGHWECTYNGETIVLKEEATQWTVPDGIFETLTLRAGYVANEYTITLYTHGVTEEKQVKATYDKGFEIEDPLLPSGYTFSHWYDENGDVFHTEGVPYQVAGDITLYAHYTINVLFKGFTSADDVTRNYQYGVDATIDPLQDANGWTFVGWYSKDELGTETDLCYDVENEYLIREYTSDITVYYSRWTKVLTLVAGDKFSVTDTADITDAKLTVERGKKLSELGVTLPKDDGIAKTDDGENWTFKAWHTSLNGKVITEETLIDDTYQTVTELYASYTSTIEIYIEHVSGLSPKTEKEYPITLGATGLFAELDEKYSYALAADEENGYTHSGWSIDGQEYLFTDGEVYTNGFVDVSFGKKTVSALFKPHKYSINFDANGGKTTPESMSLDFDEVFAFPAAIEKDGYLFASWVIGDHEYLAGEEQSRLTAIEGGILTATAKWTPLQYTVVYDVNGGDEWAENSAVQTYDQAFVLPAVTRKGYLHDGWTLATGEVNVFKVGEEQKNLTLIPDDTVTYYAVWSPIHYTVEYDVNGGDINGETLLQDTATYDVPFAFKTGATKEWYAFVGWKFGNTLYAVNELGEFTQEGMNFTAESGGVVTLVAEWKTVEYKISYYADAQSSESLATVPFTVETRNYVQPVAVPAQEGREGVWDLSALPNYDKTATAGDYKVYPKYTLISYVVKYLDENGKPIKAIPDVSYTIENMSNAFDESENFKCVDGQSVAEIQKIGYRFKDWEALNWSGTTPDWHIKTKYLQATYTPIEYTLRFFKTDTVFEEVTFTLDDASIAFPTLEEKTGYVGGWTLSREGLIDAIQVLPEGQTVIDVYATYTPIVYTVTLQTQTRVYEYPYTIESVENGGMNYTLSLLVPTLCANGERLVATGDVFLSYNVENTTLTLAFDILRDILIAEKSAEYEETFEVVFYYGYDNTVARAIYGKGESLSLPEISSQGYKLVGWEKSGTDEMAVNGESVEGALTLNAIWQRVSYTVLFENTDNAEAWSVDYEESITLPLAEKEGYRFLGWKWGEKTFVANENVKNLSQTDGETVVLVAEWRENEYNVRYDTDGGEETPANVSVKYDEAFYLANYIYKKGYIFQGWQLDDTGVIYASRAQVKNLTKKDCATVTLKAVWTPIEYTVIYVNSECDSVTYSYDEEFTLPIPPQRDGYGFHSWHYVINGEDQEIIETEIETTKLSNLTSVNGAVIEITAHWDSYFVGDSIVKFEYEDINGNPTSEQRTFSNEDPFIDEPNAPTTQTTSEMVCGWSYEQVNGATAQLVFGAVADGYVAIVYDYNGEKAYRIYQNYTLEADVSSIEPTLPKKDGYAATWRYEQDAQTGNVTAFAEYTLINAEEFTLVFDENGGAETADSKVAYTADTITLPAIQRQGYVLLGWTLGERCYSVGEVDNFNTENLPIITLTAQWEIVEYTISFNGLSESYNVRYTVESRVEDVLAQFPDATTTIMQKIGYVGAWKVPVLTVGNITVTPVYTPITFTIEYAMDGADQSFVPTLVSYDSEIVLGVPTKNGYVFNGWKYDYKLYQGDTAIVANFTTVNGGSVQLQATWKEIEEIKYTATFIAEDRIVGVVEFSINDLYNGKLIEPAIPVKEHYVGRWQDYTLLDVNFEVYAEYTPIIYAIEYVVDGVVSATAYYTVETKNEFVPVSPSKLGYIFEGWTACEQDGGNKRVEAIFKAIEYTVIFDQSELENAVFVYDQSYSAPMPNERKGYTFEKWVLTVDETTEEYYFGDALTNLSTENGAEITLTAIWTVNTYQITFEGMDVSIEYTVESDLAQLNEQIQANNVLIAEREGYNGAWETLTELSVGGKELKPVYTPIIYYVLFTNKGQTLAEEEWTVEKGSVPEFSFGNYEWKVAVTEGENTVYKDYVLEPSAFTYNEQTQRYELVLVARAVNSNAYKISFYTTDIQTGEKNPQPHITKYYELGVAIPVPEVPVIKGYLGAWDVVALEEYILNGSIVFSADYKSVTVYEEIAVVEICTIYTPITYTITYDVNGGDEASKPADYKATYDQSVELGAAPTYTGYIFGGWAYNGQAYQGGNLSFTQDETVTLTAIWIPIEYTVEYVAEGADLTPESVTVAFDEEFALPQAPTRAHYYFRCWTIDGVEYAAGTVLSKLTSVDGGEVEVKAEWTLKQYVVSFAVDSEIIATTEYTIEALQLDPTAIPDLSSYQKQHYTVAWEPYTLEGADITVNAVYMPIEYMVTFYNEQGEWVGQKIYTIETQSIQLPSVPAKAENKEHYEASWDFVELTYANMHVYPVYTPIEYVATFYNASEGTEGIEIVAEVVYTFENTALSLPVVPTGYVAWSLPEALTNGVCGNINVYPIAAGETTDGYIVTFEDEFGEEISSMLVKGEIDALPSVPVKEGYMGVWDMPEKIESNIAVRPIYTPIEYTVTFYTEQGEFVDQTKYTVLNHDIEVPSVPAKAEDNEHYEARWDIPELTYGNLSIYPIYTPKIYTVYFYLDKGSADLGDVSLAYETRIYTIEARAIEVPEIPEKTGYENAVWSNYDLNTLTDLHVYAIYANVEYTVKYIIEGGPAEKPATPESETALYDVPFTLASYEIPTGYDSEGWVCSNGQTYALGADVVNLTDKEEEVTLTLTLTPISYIINLLNQNGQSYMTINATYDSSYRMPAAFTYTGYIVNGWRKDGDGNLYQPNQSYANNLTAENGATVDLSADCTPITYTVRYYNRAQNTILQTVTVRYNESFTVRSAYAESGYAFDYWKCGNTKLSAGQTTSNLSTINGGIVNIYAIMTQTYTVTIKATGSENSSKLTISITDSYTGTSSTKSVSDSKDGDGSASYTVRKGSTVTVTSCTGDLYVNEDKDSDKAYSTSLSENLSLRAHKDSCFAAGTLLTLADGSQKKIEDLLDTDKLLVFNHETGTYDVAEILFVDRDGWREYNVLNLNFSNGDTLKVIGNHGFFNLTLNKYVYISNENYAEFIGHKFYTGKLDGNVYTASYVTLTSANVATEYTGCFSLVTSYHLNHFVNNLLSMPADTDKLVNYFEYDENLAYNREKMQVDIETYGLFTYEDFAEYLPYEVYQQLPVPYLKVAIGKGLVTFDQLLNLIAVYGERLGI